MEHEIESDVLPNNRQQLSPNFGRGGIPLGLRELIGVRVGIGLTGS